MARPSGSGVPRPRKKIRPRNAADFLSRFALHLRKIMDDNNWISKDVSEKLAAGGVDIGPRGVDVWLRGEGSPKFRDLEKIGRALGMKDYRDILPPSL
jgi:hypothetical protein